MGTELKRTNVNIERHQYDFLKRMARRKSTSLSAVIREAIAVYQKQGRTARKDDPLFSIIGSGKAGRNAARDHDKLLYSKKA